MSTTLRLDANAVASLFSTSEAKLELQQAVIAEICRRMFEKYMPQDIRFIIDAIFGAQKNMLIEAVREDATYRENFEKMFEAEIGKIKNEWTSKVVTLKPEMRAKLEEAIKKQSDELLKQAGLTGEQLIQAAAEAAFVRVNEKALANIDDRINRKINAFTNAEIDQRVQTALETALKIAKA